MMWGQTYVYCRSDLVGSFQNGYEVVLQRRVYLDLKAFGFSVMGTYVREETLCSATALDGLGFMCCGLVARV